MSGEAQGISEVLAGNPGFAHSLTQFMILRDASEVLTELQPPHHETAAAYLREIADHLMRDAGIPENFLQAMIAARPPYRDVGLSVPGHWPSQ